jgi:hypothetical protein
MEKIALKNTQVGGGANTYELMYDTPRQLIASYSQFDEIKENDSVVLNITSQNRILIPTMPLDIIVLQIVLYFSEGNEQNMRLIIAGASVSTTFQVPIGGGAVRLNLDNDRWGEGVPLRWDIQNLETTQILPQPILRGWCLTYLIPSP